MKRLLLAISLVTVLAGSGCDTTYAVQESSVVPVKSVSETKAVESAPVEKAQTRTVEEEKVKVIEPQVTPKVAAQLAPAIPSPAPKKEVAPAPAKEAAPIKTCCKTCSKGKACGDSCISRSYTCHKGPGCACDG
jgi:hypothetical protein